MENIMGITEGRLLGTCLAVVCLCSGCSIPGQGPTAGVYGENAVSEDLAFTHAAVALLEYVAYPVPALVADDEERPSLESGMLGEPLTLYDVNQHPLFYDYPVVGDEQVLLGRIRVAANKLVGTTVVAVGDEQVLLGRIRVAANKLVGTTVVAVIFPEGPWNLREAEQRVRSTAAESYPGWTIERVLPVVHDVPRMGMMAVLSRPDSDETQTIVLDFDQDSLVPIVEPAQRLNADLFAEGYVGWSLLKRNVLEGKEQYLQSWEEDSDWASGMRDFYSDADFEDLDALREVRLDRLMNLERLRRVIRERVDCEVHIAPVRAYYKQSAIGYCTAAVGRMIASRYDVWHSEQHVAGLMGIPWPNPGGYNNWATVQKELNYYRKPIGLGKANSNVFSSVSYLQDWNNYKSEILAGRPSNLRKWGTGIVHHSRVLGGIRICTRSWGQTVQLGLLDPSDEYSKFVPVESWDMFDGKVLKDNTVGTLLEIGGHVVVRD
jgi:hypothetical protein